MAKMIKIPGIGPVKSTYVYIGAAVTFGILAVAYYRHRNAAAAAQPTSATPDSTATPTDAGSGGYNPTSSGYSGYSPNGYDLYGNPLPTPTYVGNVPVSGGQYSSNNDWASAAETALYNAGVDTATSATAIGKVLAGLSVTTDQKNIFLEAIGLLGQPPQGYPQPIHVQDPVTPTKPPTPTPTPTPAALSAPSTPSVSAIDKHGATISWHAPSSGTASHYEVWDRDGGGRNHLAGTTHSTSYRIGYFKPNTHHAVWINAVDSHGHRGPASGSTNFVTHK